MKLQNAKSEYSKQLENQVESLQEELNLQTTSSKQLQTQVKLLEEQVNHLQKQLTVSKNFSCVATKLCKKYEKIVKMGIVPIFHKQLKTLLRDHMVKLKIISLYIYIKT